MNLPEAFNQLKKEEHEVSFENLGEWLDQNHKKPKTMKNIYKIAASFVLATMILIACTVPVQQEEEIGYMIKGMASPDAMNLKFKFATIPELDPSQISVHRVLHEEVGKDNAQEFTEVVMVLPEANYKVAEAKKAALSGVFEFRSIEIFPIEETVKRTLIESALHKLEFKVNDKISDAKVAARINTFLHENSNAKGNAQVKVGADGIKYVEIEVGFDENSAIGTKRSIERLVNELTPDGHKIKHENMTEEEVLELKKRELQKWNELKEKQMNN
tara:strand:+ start:61242 stop:62060 length:819 start_codon:yes stop_codon:yes gene_type:complete